MHVHAFTIIQTSVVKIFFLLLCSQRLHFFITNYEILQFKIIISHLNMFKHLTNHLNCRVCKPQCHTMGRFCMEMSYSEIINS